MPDHQPKPERARLEDPADNGSDGFTPPEPGGGADAVTQLLDEVTHETQPQPLICSHHGEVERKIYVARAYGDAAGYGEPYATKRPAVGNPE